MPPRRVIVGICLATVVAALSWMLARCGATRTEIIGTFDRQELADIKRVVGREMRHEMHEVIHLSSGTIGQRFASVRNGIRVARRGVRAVCRCDDGLVQVMPEMLSDYRGNFYFKRTYLLERKAGRWSIVTTITF